MLVRMVSTQNGTLFQFSNAAGSSQKDSTSFLFAVPRESTPVCPATRVKAVELRNDPALYGCKVKTTVLLLVLTVELRMTYSAWTFVPPAVTASIITRLPAPKNRTSAGMPVGELTL